MVSEDAGLVLLTFWNSCTKSHVQLIQVITLT